MRLLMATLLFARGFWQKKMPAVTQGSFTNEKVGRLFFYKSRF